MFLEKLSESFDIEKLILEVQGLLQQHPLIESQLSLNHRTGFLETCWSDGCGSPFKGRTVDIGDDPVVNKQANNVPRFIDTEFTNINPGLENTEIEKIYQHFSSTMKLGRYRVAAMLPKTCYGWHYDLEKRIHIPIFTNPGSFLITEDGKATHLPATGESWMFNANNGYHTAINSSYTETRIHLLLHVW